MKKTVKDLLLYLWQLPQNLLGLLVAALSGPGRSFRKRGALVFIRKGFPGGVSLGKYIILCEGSPLSVAHELGHCRQSLLLGWLYLPSVGLVSGLRAWLNLYRKGGYYDGWPESWADRLGGVKRGPDGARHV